MQRSGRLANAYENAVVDLVEAATLQGRTGERFAGSRRVGRVRRSPRRARRWSASRRWRRGSAAEQPLPVGEDVELVLAEADLDTGGASRLTRV